MTTRQESNPRRPIKSRLFYHYTTGGFYLYTPTLDAGPH